MKHVPFRIKHVGIAALLALFPASEAGAPHFTPPVKQTPPKSSYDLRGLKKVPRSGERHALDTTTATRLITPTRATPTQPRMVAEWEPVQGALIRYPLGISVDAVRIIASEIKTYVLCSAANQPYATASFQGGGVNMSNIVFIPSTTDTYWTRDYGPWWITNEENGKRAVRMLDLGYFPGGARPNDDKIPPVIATALNMSTFFGVDYFCQGGNIMTDSRHVGASTDRVFEDNKTFSLSQVQEIGLTYMGFNPYYIVTDPAYPDEYIRHIDCWSKFIAPDKVLVKRVPETDSHYAAFEEAATNWANTTDAQGNHYQVFRVNGSFASPYANHVILNDRVLVPMVTSETDPDDKTALTMIQAAYGPAYRVIGVKAAPGLPWLGTDSIHCRVNSIPVFAGLSDQDSGFIFANQPRNQTATISTTAIFNVTVTGGKEPYTYQWYKNNVPVSGATSARYPFIAKSSDNNAYFHVVVRDSSNTKKTITSSKATCKANPITPLTISTQPASQTVTAGLPVTFRVGATGGIAPYTYQWYKNNVPVSGATGESFYFPTQDAANSTNSIYAVVSDKSSPVQTAKSTSASISVVTLTMGNGSAYTEVEVNDDLDTANPVPDTAKNIVGYIGTETDYDIYMVNVDPGATLKVNMIGPDLDYDLYLFNGSGQQLTGSATSSASESMAYKNSGTTPESYYILVAGYDQAFTTAAPYYLMLSTSGANVGVAITPDTATVATGKTQLFIATVSGSTNAGVAWTCTGGQVSPSGLYTAPGIPGTYTVTATSTADSTKSASAKVTVTSGGGSTTYNEVESNDSISTGNTVPDNATKIVATIGSTSDLDFFAINVGPGRTVTVNMTGPSGTDYDLHLLNSVGTVLKRSEGSTSTERVTYQNTGSASAVYYLKVIRYSGSITTNTYNLTLSR